ncbi:MAG: 23S rRNA (adenine(2503)-C(2))-methyltransferase RlmN [Ruminococcus sp.]|jgi:23S rRNA (adenine2503-C2)-methyltransferase|nr:23S rRNA (adenine(2503)-C(2))-methyltransferase RlmN [Ruminococcus sp.]
MDFLSLTSDELTEQMLILSQKPFRAHQLDQWLHYKKVLDFDLMTDISKSFREVLKEKFQIEKLKISKILTSKTSNTKKILFELSDGYKIETVIMEYDAGLSVCISTQVGCKMGCSFCASGKNGFVRNLSAQEILLQYYQAEEEVGREIANIVLMGIGEPLDNYDNVIRFFDVLKGKFSLRNLTLSTSGIVPKMYDLAEKKLGLTLSVSLHAAFQKKREEIMPVAKKYNLTELIDACQNYINKTGRRLTFEYAVIENFNDKPEDAKELIKITDGLNCLINLIPVNDNNMGYSVSGSTVNRFKELLLGKGHCVTIRRTLGTDINSACGQLAYK